MGYLIYITRASLGLLHRFRFTLSTLQFFRFLFRLCVLLPFFVCNWIDTRPFFQFFSHTRLVARQREAPRTHNTQCRVQRRVGSISKSIRRNMFMIETWKNQLEYGRGSACRWVCGIWILDKTTGVYYSQPVAHAVYFLSHLIERKRSTQMIFLDPWDTSTW